jgi:hypothetical protein
MPSREKSKQIFDVDDVVQKVTQATFGGPLVTNVLRGHLVEAIIAMALEPDWEWCSGDYASWDFQCRNTGTRLEVKQSAAKQSWVLNPYSKPSSPRFDIAARTGRWETDGVFVRERGRAAHVYIFAHHPLTDEGADHRDPMQWRFYVVAEKDLPTAKSIGLEPVKAISNQCVHSDLQSVVNSCQSSISR